VRLHSILHGSRANGPNLRSVVWVQGCVGIGCAGCVNPATHDPNGGTEISPNELAHQLIRYAAPGTEGLTLSGGEPLQCKELLSFIQSVKFCAPDWSVGIFTGYTREELGGYSDLGARWNRIRATLDFAVVGRYDRTQPCNKPLVSSANQELVLLSDRYSLTDFGPQTEEVHIGPDGLFVITGFPVKSSFDS
jgi:anaerobic ribonucleoside-triphosphate reductase activating protein